MKRRIWYRSGSCGPQHFSKLTTSALTSHFIRLAFQTGACARVYVERSRIVQGQGDKPLGPRPYGYHQRANGSPFVISAFSSLSLAMSSHAILGAEKPEPLPLPGGLLEPSPLPRLPSPEPAVILPALSLLVSASLLASAILACVILLVFAYTVPGASCHSCPFTHALIAAPPAFSHALKAIGL